MSSIYSQHDEKKKSFIDALFPYSIAKKKKKSFSPLPTDYAATLFESLHNLH